MAKINDRDRMACADLFSQFFRTDPRHPIAAQEQVALEQLPDDVAGDGHRDGRGELGSSARAALDERHQLASEHVSQADEGRGPEPNSADRVEDESRERDANHAGEWMRDGAQAGYKGRDQEGFEAVPRECVFGSTDARIRLDGDAADQFQNSPAAAFAGFVPDRMSDEGGGERERDGDRRARLTGARQSAHRDQEGRRGHRHAELVRQDGGKKDRGTVVDQELQGVVHDRPTSSDLFH